MARRSLELSDLPDWPRCMKRETAAAYLEISVTQFDLEVKKGIWPSGLWSGKRIRWDRNEIDRWLDSREEALLLSASREAPSDMGAAWEQDAPTRRERWASR